MNTYTIRLRDCQFFGFHGVLEEETRLGQRFLVDADLTVRDDGALATDSIEGTVHYGEVFSVIEALVTGPPYKIIEALAAAIGERLLADFPLLLRAQITVRKPSAPIPGILKHVEVMVVRERLP